MTEQKQEQRAFWITAAATAAFVAYLIYVVVTETILK